MTTIELRTATPADDARICALLQPAGLPVDDVAAGKICACMRLRLA